MRNGGESSAALSRSIVFMILRTGQAGGAGIKRSFPARKALGGGETRLPEPAGGTAAIFVGYFRDRLARSFSTYSG